MHLGVIIAEYNPFHNGHAYQIEKTRQAGADHIAVILSGNFVQRGEPALFEKRLRARAALKNGADLVLELPLCYAIAGAQRFAAGAVAMADAMGCAEFLSFGSECGDLLALQKTADAVQDEKVLLLMKESLNSGLSFAAARQKAVEHCFGAPTASLLASPNDLLGMEYLLALKKQNSSLAPIVIPRVGISHNAPAPVSPYASASYLRDALAFSADFKPLSPFIPESARTLFEQELQNGHGPALLKYGERALLCAFRSAPKEQFERLPDLSEGLENRLYTALRSAGSLSEALELCKTSRYPTARLRRAVFSLYLGLEEKLSVQSPPYLRILGMNSGGQEILSEMKKSARLPVSDSLAKLQKLGNSCAEFAALEAKACDLYTLFEKEPRPCGWDYTGNAVRLLDKE